MGRQEWRYIECLLRNRREHGQMRREEWRYVECRLRNCRNPRQVRREEWRYIGKSGTGDSTSDGQSD